MSQSTKLGPDSARNRLRAKRLKLHQDGRRGRSELGLVFFSKFQVDGGEVDAMLEPFLFGFQLLDFPAHAGDLLFDFKDVLNFSGASAANILEALFGFAGVFQPGDKVGTLLADFFPILRLAFDAAEGS